MKKLLKQSLYFLSRLVMKRHKPQIVAVTGSVGKTTTKDIITTILKTQYRVRGSIKSYNNEIGLPLTIIGAKTAGRSIVGWLFIGLKALWLSLWKGHSYPEILVLEMGADRRGDLERLTAIASPDIAVLTAIGSTHLEFFKNIAEVAEEKRTIIRKLNKNGVAILNADDPLVTSTKVGAGLKVLRYGINEAVNIQASEIDAHFERGGKDGLKIIGGTSFKITFRGSTVPVHFGGVLGSPAVYSALAGAAVGLHLGLNLVDISNALKAFQGTPGRLKLIPGIKGTTILDDSYNASPTSVIAALEVLAEIPVIRNQKRWAVLGGMTELGADTEPGHQAVGEQVVESNIHKLVTVGERANTIAQVARQRGMNPDDIYTFINSKDAGKFLQDQIKPGDIILTKGSQVMRMEFIVKELMAEPLRAGELLVRQGPEWETR